MPRDIPAFRTNLGDDQGKTVLGHADNFWIWSKESGFDLTHPSTPESKPVEPRIKMKCEMTPITIDPAKTALLVSDYQNYNISRALGNNVQEYFDGEEALLKYAIPAARKAQIQIVWITTGYSPQDLQDMDPGPHRTFGFHPVLSKEWNELRTGEGYSNDSEYRNQKGMGDAISEITLEDGTKIDAGRVLVRGSWNSWMHGRLADSYEHSKTRTRPDIHFYKNRSSGMCVKMPECTEYLERENLRTLLFTGLNTDQCVMGTLQDAYLKGFDTVMLRDGCVTNSPQYAQLSCEFNCMRSWGFLSSCKDLVEAVGVGEQEQQS